MFKIESHIINLAKSLSSRLYIVGGRVRNFLINGENNGDIDLSSPTSVCEVIEKAKALGFTVLRENLALGSAHLYYDGKEYEFTTFRRESYASGGGHKPIVAEFTNDIYLDATRRDFKCNAIYCDIVSGEILDPLGGIEDIKNKKLTTTLSPDKVFSADGVRILRLARFAGELNFSVDSDTLASAKKYASNLKDISSQSVFLELNKILKADQKYSFSSKTGHYTALKILDDIRALDYILPELTLGRGMAQRKDYHNHDVLEHSLRCVKYSATDVRLSALLHDVGKPYAMKTYGKYNDHASFGEEISKAVLSRWAVNKKLTKKTLFLVKNHMIDIDGNTSENKIRAFIVKNYPYIVDLLAIKQADFSASKDDLSICPAKLKWQGIIDKMKYEKTPFTIKELNVTAQELISIGLNKNLSGVLNGLLIDCAVSPRLNKKETLVKLALKKRPVN